MRLIEYSAPAASLEEADQALTAIHDTGRPLHTRRLRDGDGYRVLAYFPLGQTDERAPLPYGYRVVEIPETLWPEPAGAPPRSQRRR